MSETASNKELHIFDICGHGFPKFHTTFGVKRHNHLSIEVACDGAHRQRSDTIGQGSEPQWSQTFVFGDPSGSVSIRLFIKHAFSGGEFIGEIQEEVAKLALGSTTVNNGVDGGQRTEPQPLRNFTGDGPTPSISFRYFFSAKTSLNVAGLDEMQRAKEAAEKAIVKFNTATESQSFILDPSAGITQSVKTLTPLAQDTVNLLQTIAPVQGLLDKISEVHPYAKLAWQVLSLPFKIAKAQLKRDNELSALVEAINSAYIFVGTFWSHLNVAEMEDKKLKEITGNLVIYTLNCGTFICEKCANDPEGFFKRAFSNTVKGAVIDDQIKQFKASFESQRKELDQLLNADNFSRIRTLLDDMLTAKLDRIPYVRNASFSQDYICLQDTRTRILEEIREWVEAEPPSDSKGASLFLLTGFAGSGKSAIAHTIAYRFSAGLDTTRGRLGSSFFFKALSDTEHEKRSAAALFSNISRELASQPENREWKKALGSIIDARFALINSPAPSARFDNLIRDPSQYLTVNFIDPVLIVIDSLDECKSAPVERKALLTILSSHLHEFPSNFRIFVTSRPEDELTNLKFPEGSHVERRDLETWQKDSIDQDLQRYYESRLGDLDESVTSSLDTRWPSRSWVAELIQRSEGLFQWAFTMCRELVAPGQVPVKFLNDVIQSKSGLGAMDKLYEEVLRDKFGSDPVQTKGVCSVLGFILCVRTPLPVSSLIALGETPDTAGSTQSVVRHLGSVLAGVSTDSELTSPIHAYHTSFLDFLFREGRSNLYHIDRLVQDKAIVEACLRVLTSEKLRFNICDIKSSHLSLDSSQVEAVANWLQRCGLGHLIYASQFWSVHLAQTAFDADLAALLHTFIRRKFLFWLELLAGIGQVHGAGNALKSMVSWAQHGGTQGFAPSLVQFGKDAGRFVSNFADIIARNPAHIYLSALPFAPITSLISKQFLPQFGGTIRAHKGTRDKWGAVIRSFSNRADAEDPCIKSMALSQDGAYLLTSAKNSISLWNPETGQLLIPFETTDPRPLLAISPDSKLFAVATENYGTDIIGLPKGDVVFGALAVMGYYRAVISLSFSPDSKTLWIGCYDGAISARNVEDGSEAFSTSLWDLGPEYGYLGSMAMSRDTTRLAFVPYNHPLRVYERTGDGMAWSMKHELSSYNSDMGDLALSDDGRTLVTGGASGRLHIWDVESGTLRSQSDATAKHAGTVSCVAVSAGLDPFIASGGLSDMTLRLADGRSGTLLGNPVTGLEYLVELLFSPDGEQIIAGADDGTIYVMDRETIGLASPQQPQGASLLKVEVSPDGKSLYAASTDTSIMCFNMHDGTLAFTLEGHSSTVRNFAISPDGKLLASSSYDRTIRIWDTRTRTLVKDALTAKAIDVVAFDDKGERFLSCSEAETIIVRDTMKWEIIVELKGHHNEVTSARFFDDGKRIISGSSDGTIRIWDATSGEPIGVPCTLHDVGVFRVSLSPNGELVASSSIDGTIWLWNLKDFLAQKSPYPYGSIKHGTSLVNSLAFTVDGQKLLSTSEDHTVRLWDVSTKEMILVGHPWEGHSSGVNRAFLYNNETQIVSVADDGVIRVWDVESDDSKTGSQAELERSFPRINDEGWVYSDGADGEEPKLLFWLPPHYRPTFVWGRCKRLIGAEATELDFSRFKYGDQWTECRTDAVA